MITRVLLPHRENIIDLTPRAPAQPRARLQCWKGCRTIAESYDWLGGRMRRAYGDRRGPRREDPHLEAKKSWESPTKFPRLSPDKKGAEDYQIQARTGQFNDAVNWPVRA